MLCTKQSELGLGFVKAHCQSYNLIHSAHLRAASYVSANLDPWLCGLHWHCSGPDTTIYQRSRKAAAAEAAEAATTETNAGATTTLVASVGATNHNVSSELESSSLECLLPLDRSWG